MFIDAIAGYHPMCQVNSAHKYIIHFIAIITFCHVMDSYCLQAIISMSMRMREGGGPTALELDYKLLLDWSRSTHARNPAAHVPLVQQCPGDRVFLQN